MPKRHAKQRHVLVVAEPPNASGSLDATSYPEGITPLCL
jgi:hypothetical protein